ncbi:hypothetical protein PIB30_027293 [Stylosanthes scabra]|uniref:RRM domain-containing protein n=1 Tax=Stylosanthes scabra TaxID=79078 RepID=A0ABU6YAX7_9FABA|nr:hypothetical protein [Stylosanthes scabra]
MRAGVSRGVRAERGKHGEGFGYAERRNKGESVGGFALVLGGATKRDIYKEFGKDGYIADIYISKKERKRANRLFAFIRFHSHGGAMKSIKRMNGKGWGEAQLYVVLSKYDRQPRNQRDKARTILQNQVKKRTVRKWVVMKDNRINEKVTIDIPQKKPQTKTIEGVWAEDQRELLQRSLLGCSVKPIEFRKVRTFFLMNGAAREI